MENEKQVKQVIVFRKDLLKGEHAIRKGKFAGQVAHASVGALMENIWKGHIGVNNDINFWHFTFANNDKSPLNLWLNGIFTKVVVSVNNDEELLTLYNKIKTENNKIPIKLITDCGNTEFHGVHTNTCIGIGPWWSDEIDVFTKELPLL